MIVAQLAHALLVSALIALSATCLARLVRATRRPTRHLWFAALMLSAAWPLLQGAVLALLPAPTAATATLGVRLLEPIVIGVTDSASRWSPSDLLIVLWFAMSTILLARLAAGAWRLTRFRRRWQSDRIDGVAVRVAPTTGPAVVGFGRMEIVLPAWMLTLDPALRMLALRHEEEHRAARDPWLLLAAALVVALLPWNLPLWWIARRLRLAIEMDCDARVLAHYPDAKRYGRLLLLVAQRSGQAWPLAPALTEPVTNLQRRIDAMSSSFRLSRTRGLLVGSLASLALAAACTLRSPLNATNTTTPPSAAAVAAEAPMVMDANAAYFEFQVEKQAQVSRSVPPRYPQELRAAGTSGEVLVQFVVDTLGRIEASSMKVVKSSHPDFSAAALATLPQTSFTAAEIGGRKVRQLVQMPFQFKVEKTAAAPPPAATPAPSAKPEPQPAREGGFFEFAVSRQATIKDAVAPRYPKELREAKVEGEVVAAFVVDANGRADTSSLKVIRSSHVAFTQSVKEALTEMTFTPAAVDGRRVRQLIQMPFQFSLSR